MSSTHVWVNEGLLVWDGSVLELFRNDGRDGNWRMHALVVIRIEFEPRRGVTQLKVWDSKSHYETAMVPDDQLAAVRALVTQIGPVS